MIIDLKSQLSAALFYLKKGPASVADKRIIG